MTVNRRAFIKTTGVAIAGACACGMGVSGCGMILGKSNTPKAPEGSVNREDGKLLVNLAMIPQLQADGGSVKFSYEGENGEESKVIIARLKGDDYRAYANSCTHGHREIEYKPDKNMLQCVSFGHSKFDLDGNVLGGPAKGPLTIYEVALEGNRLVLTI